MVSGDLISVTDVTSLCIYILSDKVDYDQGKLGVAFSYAIMLKSCKKFYFSD